MQLNDFIAVQFPQEPGKSYFAIVTKTLPDNTFESRFVHSGSRYTFKTYSGWLEVLKSTGAFKPGTKTNNVQLFTESTTDHLNVGVNVRVTFDDGNGYLGVITSATGGFEVRFLHSGNIYQFDTEGVAHHAGSPYDGRKALEFKPYTAGKSLFAGTTDSTISFDIKNEMNGQRMSGELEVTIKRTDTEEVLYSNQYLYADDAAARDNISLGVQEGQNLLILVDYHPAKEPYTTHPTSSPDIDRETTISGSQIFSYKKVSELLFRVDIQNEVTSVTATSGTQAVNTVFSQVTTNHSHTFETKFGGEAAITLFGVGGKISGGGSSSNTTGGGTTDGQSDASGSSSSVSTTYNVYYPKGILITPNF